MDWLAINHYEELLAFQCQDMILFVVFINTERLVRTSTEREFYSFAFLKLVKTGPWIDLNEYRFVFRVVEFELVHNHFLLNCPSILEFQSVLRMHSPIYRDLRHAPAGNLLALD
jgi:hypothetical protein